MLSTTVSIFMPDGAIIVAEFPLPDRPGLERIREIVEPHLNGGEMERVAVLHEGGPCDMFVDETGHIKRLKPNPNATAIYHAASKARGLNTSRAPIIVGPAVLFHRRVWF
jgi:hypothetical protein